MTFKQKVKALAFWVIVLVSSGMLYAGIQGVREIRPVEAYTDQGVITFAPQKIVRQQEERSTSVRLYRNHSTQTVYYVQYRSVDSKPRYTFKHRVGLSQLGAKKLMDAGLTQRRVLTYHDERTSRNMIRLVEPDKSVADFVWEHAIYYQGLVLAGGALLLLLVGRCGYKLLKKYSKKAVDPLTEALSQQQKPQK